MYGPSKADMPDDGGGGTALGMADDPSARTASAATATAAAAPAKPTKHKPTAAPPKHSDAKHSQSFTATASGSGTGSGSSSGSGSGSRLNALPTQCEHVLVAPSDTGVSAKKVERALLVVRFNAEGEYAMTGGRDRTPRLWNPHKGVHVQAYGGIHGYEVADIAIARDNRRFASVGGDRLAFLWDVETATVLKRLKGHTERINCVRFSGDDDAAEPGAVLVTGSYDKTVRIWDNRSRLTEPIATLSDFTDSVTSCVMTDHLIVTGCVDGRVRTFDVRNGKRVTDTIAQPVTHVALSHDRQCVLVASLDSTLRLLDVATGELLNSYTGHTNTRYKLEACLTATDAHVVAGSEDHSVCVWSLVDGALVHRLKGHTREVLSIAWHPNTATPCLLSASTDGTLRVWK